MKLLRVDLKSRAAAEKILNSGSTTGAGFFLLKMPSGIPQLQNDMLHASEAFFSLPSVTKLRCANDQSCMYRHGGIAIPSTGPGYRSIGGDSAFVHDLRESFNIGFVNNKWPSRMEWFKKTCELWRDAMAEISAELQDIIARALVLEPGRLSEIDHTECSLAGLVKYSCQPSNEKARQFGVRPHQDDGIFTLLATDGQPGLQICPSWSGAQWNRSESMFDESLHWIPVDPVPDYFIVNFGTVAYRISKGLLRSTLHRVVRSNCTAPRYSLPYFHEPCLDFKLSKTGETHGDMLLEQLRKDRGGEA